MIELLDKGKVVRLVCPVVQLNLICKILGFKCTLQKVRISMSTPKTILDGVYI